jgi:hypothetical protein
VDVTDLPLTAWPHPLSPWDTPAWGTLADRWLGHSWSQRALNLVALALAVLLLCSAVVAFVTSSDYGSSHLSDCGAMGCPPSFSTQLTAPSAMLSVCILYLSQIGRIAWIERQCGVWLRSGIGRNPGAYIRHPGVTSEAAATALQRYAGEALGSRPLAQFFLLSVLAFLPLFLLAIGDQLLPTWLSMQWIPR